MPDLSLTPKATLLADVDVSGAITSLKALLTTYETTRLANFNMTNPEARLEEINLEIQTAELSEIAALQQEAAEIMSFFPKYGAPGIPAKRNAIRQVNAAFGDSKTAIVALCNTILGKLAGYLATAQAAEITFFGTYNQASVATTVSSRYVQAAAQVQALLNGWNNPGAFTNDGFSTYNGQAINLFDWLGVAQID